MLAIPFNKLAAPSNRVFLELRLAYEALRIAALRESDFRAYLEADLTLASLAAAKYLLDSPQLSSRPAYYLKAEPCDSALDLFRVRSGLGDRPPAGWAPPAGG